MRRREFIILAGGAALALPWAARVAGDADFSIDGVPFPSDATVAAIPKFGTDLQRHWSGVWVGAWDGILKHILLVERIGEDGSARVVYAVGKNPYTGADGRWSRLDAVASGNALTVRGGQFTATYEMDDDEQLSAVYKARFRPVRADMSKTDLASLIKPDAVVAWSRGTSEMLSTNLREDGAPVRLETVIFKPPGRGPFPLAVINHGSTGKPLNLELAKQTWVSLELADFLNKRGWLVAFPQRRGRGRSDGLYDEGIQQIDKFSAKFGLKPNYTCDTDIALKGADRALTDIDAAIASLRYRQDVAAAPVLIGGHSRGGVLSVAYAGLHPEQTLGVINFVGGWLSDECPDAEFVNQTLFARGGRYGQRTIWLYGHNDPIYSVTYSKKNFAAFEKAGGQGTFFEFDMPSEQGHQVIHYPDLWSGPVGDYLNSLSGNALKANQSVSGEK